MPIKKKRPPKKSALKPNQKYLKDWDDYLAARPGKTPILLPIAVDIEDGEIVRNRIKAGDVEKVISRCKKELPKYLSDKLINPHDTSSIFEDYIEYFKDIDGAQGPVATPLDLSTPKAVWVLFYLPRENWKFSKDRQYSTENDRDDLLRNFEKICTLDDRNYLLLANNCRSNPKGLKFNLHVTISQMIDGIAMETPIIIDPGSDNGGGGGGGHD